VLIKAHETQLAGLFRTASFSPELL